MEELEEMATPVPNIFERTQITSHNKNVPILFEKHFTNLSSRLESEM